MSENTRHYVQDFNRAIYIRSLKNFGVTFLVCVTLLMGFAWVGTKVSGGKDTYTASTQNVVKFAKVQDNSRDVFVGGETTALAGANSQQGLNIKSLNSSMSNIDLSNESKSIDSGGTIVDDEKNDVKSESVASESSFESFVAYVDGNVRIRSTPSKDDNSNIIADKSDGYSVNVIGEDEDWWKIKWNEDGYAYIHKTCVKTK